MAEDTQIVFGFFHKDQDEYQSFLKLFEDGAPESRTFAGRVQFPWDNLQSQFQDESSYYEAAPQPLRDPSGAAEERINSSSNQQIGSVAAAENVNYIENVETLIEHNPNQATQSLYLPPNSAINDYQHTNNETKEKDGYIKTDNDASVDEGTRKRRNKKKRDPNYYKQYTDRTDLTNVPFQEQPRDYVAIQMEPESSSSSLEGFCLESASISATSSGNTSSEEKVTQSDSQNISNLPLDHRTSGPIQGSNISQINLPASIPNNVVESQTVYNSTAQNISLSNDDVPMDTGGIVDSSGTSQCFVSQEGNERTLIGNAPITIQGKPEGQSNIEVSKLEVTLERNVETDCKKEMILNVTKSEAEIEENPVESTLPAQPISQVQEHSAPPNPPSNTPDPPAPTSQPTNTSQPSQAPIAPAPAPEEKPTPAPPKPTSWASLFKGGSSGSTTSTAPQTVMSYNSPTPSESVQDRDDGNDDSGEPVSVEKDSKVKKLGAYFKNITVSNRPMFLQPRGLINVANNCYINSILQIIIACPPFYNFIQGVPLPLKGRGPSATPMLDAIFQLSRQFNEIPLKSVNKKSQDLRQGDPFEPTMVYTMLTKVNTTLGIKQGRQEDAEEFLGCLLNGLHDEMVAAIQVGNGVPHENGPKEPIPNGISSDAASQDKEQDEDGDDEWEQVGPKNKSSVIRKADFNRSPVYDIFGGQMRSALHQQGVKESAMLQPFFTLQLDIQSPKIVTVKDALENLGTREAVHGFMSNKTKTEVEASKRTSLEELPPVLILHLKRFVYDKTGGCQKLMKRMEYEMDLEISRDLLSPSARVKIPMSQRFYKLFAVIYHTGKETFGGHYISDFYHVGSNQWVRADDNNIKGVSAIQVLKPPIPFTPYLLFYRRSQNSMSGGRSTQVQAKT